jgi:hypothetical protein
VVIQVQLESKELHPFWARVVPPMAKLASPAVRPIVSNSIESKLLILCFEVEVSFLIFSLSNKNEKQPLDSVYTNANKNIRIVINISFSVNKKTQKLPSLNIDKSLTRLLAHRQDTTRAREA